MPSGSCRPLLSALRLRAPAFPLIGPCGDIAASFADLEPTAFRISIPFLVLVALEDLALAGMVGLPDNALVLHPLHQRSGAVVADLQASLDVAGGGLLVAQHDLHRLLIE